MPYVIAQVSDVHVGGPNAGSGERLSLAVHEINAMGRRPDLVVLTGDLTHDGSAGQWAELQARLAPLVAPWVAIPGNHDRAIAELRGHRAMDAGPLRLALLDTSSDRFSADDAAWLDHEFMTHAAVPTVVALHHPPFETGIWWMDCVGLSGSELFEAVVRRHPQVRKVLAGHVHRLIQTNWGGCSLWVCPSTAVSVAADLDPAHDPAETAEPPSISLHAYVGDEFVSYLVPVGASAARSPIERNSPGVVARMRDVQGARPSRFA